MVPKVEEPVIDEKGEPEALAIPRTGVEVVSVVERKGVSYYALRDLRNGNVVKNVTEKSARRLWHYAIKSYAGIPEDINKAKVQWQGDVGILRSYTAGSNQAFDLIERKGKKTRYFFGVTEDGIHTTWRDLVGLGDD